MRWLRRLACALIGHRPEESAIVEGRCERCGAFVILLYERGRLVWREVK